MSVLEIPKIKLKSIYATNEQVEITVETPEAMTVMLSADLFWRTDSGYPEAQPPIGQSARTLDLDKGENHITVTGQELDRLSLLVSAHYLRIYFSDPENHGNGQETYLTFGFYPSNSTQAEQAI